MGEHEGVFLIFQPGTQKHISKKCPINGQYNLTVFCYDIIQQLLGILLQIIALINLLSQKSSV